MTSITKRTDEAGQWLKKHQKAEALRQTLYWIQAEVAYHLKKNHLWKFTVGEGVGTWGSFCSEVLQTPASTIDHRVICYEFYVLFHKFTKEELGQYDAYSLYYIAAYGKDMQRDIVKEMMESSLVLGRQDLIKTLMGKEDCEHEPMEVEQTVCKKCKRKL